MFSLTYIRILSGGPDRLSTAYCSSVAASSFAATSVVLRARTNTDRVTQISPEMVLAATVKFANDKQPLVLYMSSSFWLLGVESRDFSQAEKERKCFQS